MKLETTFRRDFYRPVTLEYYYYLGDREKDYFVKQSNILMRETHYESTDGESCFMFFIRSNSFSEVLKNLISEGLCEELTDVVRYAFDMGDVEYLSIIFVNCRRKPRIEKRNNEETK